MRRFIFCLLLTLSVSSCVKDATVDICDGLDPQDRIYATFDDEPNRVEMSLEHHMVWTKGDYLFVYGPNSCKRYKFDGKTGDREATFTRTNTYTPYDFEVDGYYAVAPYGGRGSANVDPTRICFFSDTKGTMNQLYNTNSCGSVGDNLVFATSKDGVNFRFKSIMGYLRVSLTGDKSVKNIELINHSGDNISGRYYFYVDNPDVVYLYSEPAPQSTILLDCGSGVKLSAAPTDFYFVVKPMQLTAGITLCVNFTDGTTFVQSTTKQMTIKRNTVQPMGVINTSGVEYQMLGVKYSGTTFEVPTFEGATSISGYLDFGDGTTSILSLTKSYDFTDGKQTHTITANVRNANRVKISSCQGVEQIDLSNF